MYDGYTDERTMSPSQLIDMVSDIPGFLDFINDRPIHIFFKPLETTSSSLYLPYCKIHLEVSKGHY